VLFVENTRESQHFSVPAVVPVVPVVLVVVVDTVVFVVVTVVVDGVVVIVFVIVAVVGVPGEAVDEQDIAVVPSEFWAGGAQPHAVVLKYQLVEKWGQAEPPSP